ncbi:conserved Plasmodium protein, unknown function [Plasmodium gallinaceum]|uniref:Uncharacterized protein n=1 Tax=Plasmodium gallinaceum TaxID=5849 RepID=A0A1J1GLA5_PLAGA|nr:conserved Plasmodium protein, unknown function [Plasmodium gallinaceum]CRG92981.1 conserved Plasmodium protein, unknown function [Plasmodium gallinaceum]
MGIENYFLKYVKVTYLSRRRSEMIKTIENLKKNIYTYNNYSCKNIIYHMNEDEENFKNQFNVKIDENILNILNLINPLNLNNEKNSELPISNNINKDYNNLKENNKNISDENSINKNYLNKNIMNDKNTYILKYKINHIIGKRGKREQYRYTYLKSPFKYKYALRHYVFEKYKYHFYFYNITHFNINIIFNIILSSMTSNTSVKCNINWFYPGDNLFDSMFFRKSFNIFIENNIKSSIMNSNIKNQMEELKNLEERNKLEHHFYDINLDLNKYNIQDLLPLFLENKLFSENYKKLILLEEKSFKQMKKKIRKKNVHWFLNKNPNV